MKQKLSTSNFCYFLSTLITSHYSSPETYTVSDSLELFAAVSSA
ncbi:hypothetical protein [Clostridium sp.]